MNTNSNTRFSNYGNNYNRNYSNRNQSYRDQPRPSHPRPIQRTGEGSIQPSNTVVYESDVYPLNSKKEESTPDYMLKHLFGENTVPRKSYDPKGGATAKVLVNGHAMTGMLDTGAGPTIINDKLVSKLKLKKTEWQGLRIKIFDNIRKPLEGTNVEIQLGDRNHQFR